MPTYYDPRKRKYVESKLAFGPKPHTGVWKRGYKRKRLMGKRGRYYIRHYDDGRKMVSFQFYDAYQNRVTNTIELGEWDDVKRYHWWCDRRKGLRKIIPDDPFDKVYKNGKPNPDNALEVNL